MKINNRCGFTIAELLIVVAIIAVLVAIAIPVFSNTLETSREATDAANIRSAYSELMVQILSNPSTNGSYSATGKLKQRMAGWDTQPDWPDALSAGMGTPAAGNQSFTITIDENSGTVSTTFG